MAPIPPTKSLSAREKRLARIRGDIHPLAPHKTHREGANVSEDFLSNKADKRIIKRSSFVTKIQKANKKPLKRRRPSKKLVATLESLADALPSLDETAGNLQQLREGRIRHKSLKSRPGALKRKEKIVKGEMQRFGANMARLVAVKETVAVKDVKDDQETDDANNTPGSGSTSNRWAALRKHISTTMEQNPAFVP